MLLFKILNDVIEKKKGNAIQNMDDETEFSPFMCQRYLSMFSTDFAEIVNGSSNLLWKVMNNNKRTWYNFFLGVIPKTRFRMIEYIKKEKKSTKKGIEKEYIEHLSNRLEISQREVIRYIEQEGLTNTQLKKLLGE